MWICTNWKITKLCLIWTSTTSSVGSNLDTTCITRNQRRVSMEISINSLIQRFQGKRVSNLSMIVEIYAPCTVLGQLITTQDHTKKKRLRGQAHERLIASNTYVMLEVTIVNVCLRINISINISTLWWINVNLW